MARKDCKCQDKTYWICKSYVPQWQATRSLIHCVKCDATWGSRADYVVELVGKSETELRERLSTIKELLKGDIF